MSGEKLPSENVREPKGFGEHARGPAAENAHEQGWDLNEEERTRIPAGKQNTYGGNDYDYGARDFGDDPIDTTAGSERPEDIDKVREVLRKES